ncbi:unnamed protein product, partial [Ectocarpus sp. 8 AP-2014]
QFTLFAFLSRPLVETPRLRNFRRSPVLSLFSLGSHNLHPRLPPSLSYCNEFGFNLYARNFFCVSPHSSGSDLAKPYQTTSNTSSTHSSRFMILAGMLLSPFCLACAWPLTGVVVIAVA